MFCRRVYQLVMCGWVAPMQMMEIAPWQLSLCTLVEFEDDQESHTLEEYLFVRTICCNLSIVTHGKKMHNQLILRYLILWKVFGCQLFRNIHNK